MRTCCRPTNIGSSGATPRTPTSAASCACSPICRSTRSRGWNRLQGAEINEAKKVLANEATALLHGRDGGRTRGGDRAARLSSKARVARRPADRRRRRAPNWRPASACFRRFVRAGLVASTGEARRQIKGGGLKVNDIAVTDERATLSHADLSMPARSSCRSAASVTCCCGRNRLRPLRGYQATPSRPSATAIMDTNSPTTQTPANSSANDPCRNSLPARAKANQCG